MKEARILRVVVASPNDVKPERNAVQGIIAEVNKLVAEDRGVRLEISRWEHDAYAGFHVDGPQGLIDEILRIEDCDIFIGIFWKRFGTPTKSARSGTEHEFLRAYEAWSQKGWPKIMFFFSEKRANPDSKEETDQWGQVLEFKRNFPEKGLFWTYKSLAGFKETFRNQSGNLIRKEFPLKNALSPPPTEAEKAGKPTLPPGEKVSANAATPAAPSAESGASEAISEDKIRPAPPESLLRKTPEDLIEEYRVHLSEKIGKLFLFDDPEPHEIERVFVDCNIIERYYRPAIKHPHIKRADTGGQRPYNFSEDESSADAEIQKDSNGLNHTIKSAHLLRGRVQAVVVGAPGCGKTTLLKYLASKLLKESQRLPVFLELKTIVAEEFGGAKGNLAELLFEKAVAGLFHVREEDKEEFKKAFFDLLASGEVAIFLDGLDELRWASFFTDLCNSVSEFARSAYRNNSLIISTRPYALQARFDGLREMEIAPLNDVQIKKFLLRHYGDHPHDQRLLQASPFLRRLRELRRVPFLLAVMVRLHRSGKNIIEDRFDLYEHIAQRLAAHLDGEKSVRRFQAQKNDPEGLLRLQFLEELACDTLLIDTVAQGAVGQGTARLVFSGQLLIEKVRIFLGKESGLRGINPSLFYSDIKATPFLREVGDDIYSFAHLTLQEYLAARALSKRKDFLEVFCRAYFNPRLAEMEVLAMALGMVSDPDAVYSTLERLPEPLNFAGLRIRGRGLAYTQKISEARLDALIKKLVDFICERNIEETPYAKSILQSFSGASGRALDSIMTHLLSLGVPENRHKDIYPKIVFALGRLGDERAVPVLSEALMNGDSSVRARAADALGRIGGRKAVSALLDAMKDGLSTPVRWVASDALKLIGDERAICELVRAFTDTSNSNRESLSGVLGQIGGKLATDALKKGLTDPDFRIRASSATALGSIGDGSAVKALVERLLSDPYDSVRGNAALALGEVGHVGAVRALIEAMSHTDNYVSESAAAALGKIGDEFALAALSNALRSGNENLVSVALEAIERIGSDKAVEALGEALNDEESLRFEAVRISARQALIRMISSQSAPQPLGSQREELIRTPPTAADWILQAGETNGVARLIDNLRSPNVETRIAVAEALERMNLEELVTGLQNALRYHSDYVRKRAALTIGYYSHDAGLLNVLENLTSSNTIDNEVLAAAEIAQGQVAFKMACLKPS